MPEYAEFREAVDRVHAASENLALAVEEAHARAGEDPVARSQLLEVIERVQNHLKGRTERVLTEIRPRVPPDGNGDGDGNGDDDDDDRAAAESRRPAEQPG